MWGLVLLYCYNYNVLLIPKWMLSSRCCKFKMVTLIQEDNTEQIFHFVKTFLHVWFKKVFLSNNMDNIRSASCGTYWFGKFFQEFLLLHCGARLQEERFIWVITKHYHWTRGETTNLKKKSKIFMQDNIPEQRFLYHHQEKRWAHSWPSICGQLPYCPKN